jgi:hypothetical protein
LIKVKDIRPGSAPAWRKEESCMTGQLIEVAPQGGGWTVTLRRRIRGVFQASAEAVTYARNLSDELERRGEHPRIRVHFNPTPTTLAH